MKIFTRVSLIAVAIFLHASLYAQYDTGVSDVRVSTTPSNTVPAGFVSSIYYTLTNVGPALTTNENIVTGVIINGDTAFGPLTVSGDIPQGTEVNIPHAVTINGNLVTFYYEFEATEPFFSICAFSFVQEGEDNPANNFVCHDTVFVNTNATNDWSADMITLHKPENIDGFDLDNNQNTVPELDSLSATFTNIGNMTYTERTRLNYRIGLAGDTTNVTGTLFAGDLAPGESTTRIINNPAILPVVPQDSGTYNLCAIVNVLGDDVSSNNSTCTSFTIIDSYNPFLPGNWPTGQDEVLASELNIVPTTDQVLIQGVQNRTMVTVSDMQGRIIEMNELQKNGSINLETHSTGIYIIKAVDQTTGETQMRKVSK